MIADNTEKLSPEKPSQAQIDACFSMICRIDPAAPDALAQLRALDANTLVADLDFTSATFAEVIKAMPAFAGTPMIDGKIVIGEPEEMLLKRKAAAVPIIIGTVAQEPPLYFPPRKDPYPYAYFGDKEGRAHQVYTNIPSFDVMLVGADMSMHEPARFVAKAMTAAGNPAWLYRFSYVVESNLLGRFAGAGHSSEVPFLFQTLDVAYPKENITINDKDRMMARFFSGYFANFAKSPRDNPDPNYGSQLPPWPKITATNTQLMHFYFDLQRPTFVFGDDPIKDRIDLVGSVATQP
jgi:para-nitrobenzyl esterase